MSNLVYPFTWQLANADYTAINIGTCQPTPILQLAETLTKIYNKPVKPEISRRYRKGDIRHCYANIPKAQTLLNFKPSTTLKQGLKELTTWAENHRDTPDLFTKALKELEDKKLAK